MVLLGHVLVIVVVMLRLLEGFLAHALYGWEQLVCSWWWSEAPRRAHCEAVGGHWDICVSLFRRIHLSPAHILSRNDSRLVLESDLIFGAFGDQVSILFAGRVKEVQLFAPIAVALGLCAIITTRLVLVALQMSLPTRQASCACSLGLALRSSVTSSLLRRLVTRRVVPWRRCYNNSASHPADLPSACSLTGTRAPQLAQHFEDEVAQDCAATDRCSYFQCVGDNADSPGKGLRAQGRVS